MKRNDDLIKLVDTLKKREEILINKKSIRQYNRCFDKMRKYARNLINNNRQGELLPYLECESVSIQCDVAGLLFHCYPEICREVLEKIGDLTVESGLQKCFINVSISAQMSLEVGIPEDYP